MGKQFDELAKGLASGQSRRQVLRRFAAGVAGAVLATVIPSRTVEAGLRKGDLRECDDICSRAFSRQSRDYKRCVAECIACAIKDGEFSVNGTKTLFFNGSFPINGRFACFR
jgi:hypothetical protein